jgi:hypothetical protein
MLSISLSQHRLPYLERLHVDVMRGSRNWVSGKSSACLFWIVSVVWENFVDFLDGVNFTIEGGRGEDVNQD